MYRIENLPNEFHSIESLISYALDAGIDPSATIFHNDDPIGSIEDYLVFI